MLLAIAHDHVQLNGVGLQGVQSPVAWTADQLCPSDFVTVRGNVHTVQSVADSTLVPTVRHPPSGG
jgi:hypothetical protein